MPKLVVLGSSNAIPDESHENTHMAIVGDQQIVLIDCPGNPVVRLRRAGLDIHVVDDIILTHFHPDHASGLSLLLMDMWLLRRKRALNVHGLDYTIERVEKMMELYGWSDWPGFFPVRFKRLAEAEMTLVLAAKEWCIFSSPVNHLIPNIGLRVEFLRSNKVLAYSSDTEPAAQVVRLAYQADVLIHESAGATRGHTGAAQAGAIAQEAKAAGLYLIHYPTGDFKSDSLIGEAASMFDGSVALAEDLMQLNF